jgi:hypothetical protein
METVDLNVVAVSLGIEFNLSAAGQTDSADLLTAYEADPG